MKPNNFTEFCSKYSQIQVCSYDAGGGNVLANLVDGLGLDTSFIVAGPSVEIYAGLFHQFSVQNKKTLDLTTDLLISSTGWQSSFEFEKIGEAVSRGIPVVAVLDHWTNYIERFERLGKKISPTFFLALDDYAEKKILHDFINPKVLKAKNFYIARILAEIENLRSSITNNSYDLIFVGEPLSRTGGSSRWNEIDAIKELFKVLRSNGLADLRVAIKPHPSEESTKYDRYIPSDFKNVNIVDKTKLSVLLAESKAVVGCHSMALYIAELCGNRVYTILPPGMLSMIPLTRAQPITNLSNNYA